MGLDEMKADTVSILTDWGESLVVKRATTIAYDDEGKPTQTWTTVGTYSGDWQPVTRRLMGGSTTRVEAGVIIRTTSQVIFPVTVDVEERDRIYREDGSYEDVDSVARYEDHITVFLIKTEKEE